LRQACEGGLRRLGLDQIALYQFHRPDPDVPLEDSIGTLVALKEEGKIRHIGLSNVNQDQLRRAQATTAIVSIQNRYNPGDRRSDTLVDLCEQEGIIFLPWAPVQNLDRFPALTDIARRHEATVHQIAFACCWPIRNDTDDPWYRLGRPPRGECGRRRPATRP
jgi:pyridoxine 4-dehydrogenase